MPKYLIVLLLTLRAGFCGVTVQFDDSVKASERGVFQDRPLAAGPMDVDLVDPLGLAHTDQEPRVIR